MFLYNKPINLSMINLFYLQVFSLLSSYLKFLINFRSFISSFIRTIIFVHPNATRSWKQILIWVRDSCLNYDSTSTISFVQTRYIDFSIQVFTLRTLWFAIWFQVSFWFYFQLYYVLLFHILIYGFVNN